MSYNQNSFQKKENENIHGLHALIALWFRTTMNWDISTLATRSSVCSFARIAHSIASLACSSAPTHSLNRSLHSVPSSCESELLDSYFFWVFFLFWTMVHGCLPRGTFLLNKRRGIWRGREKANHGHPWFWFCVWKSSMTDKRCTGLVKRWMEKGTTWAPFT